MRPSRRELLAAAAAAAAGVGPAAAEAGEIVYLAPAAGRGRLALKVWLGAPPSAPPRLTVDGREALSAPLDDTGLRWGFEASGLTPGRRYTLDLRSGSGLRLREPWALATLPPRESRPESLRILVFTCAGGDPATPGLPGRTAFLPLAARHALLERGLSLAPDLVIANGDHVYWDQVSNLEHPNPEIRAAFRALYSQIAQFDPARPASHPANRQALTTVLTRQIAAVYGQRLAAFPTLFVADDHDYFENDVAGPTGATFPPSPFLRHLQALTRRLAYPPNLSPTVAGVVQPLQWGALAELLLYDCRGGLGRGPADGLLSRSAEAFVASRTARSRASTLIHMPSTPFGWTAGKWAEWYPDRNTAPLGATAYADDKAYWNPAWFAQHQRLLTSLAARQTGAVLSVSGDLHASGACEIWESGGDTLQRPVTSLLAGPVGTGDLGFPSAARGQGARLSTALAARPLTPLREENGFAILHVRRDRIEAELYAWRPPSPVEEIAALLPSEKVTVHG